jgi:uncharacterized protein with HEPN domain
MSSKPRSWKFRIQHILDTIAENTSYVRDMTYRDFCADVKTLKAVVWNVVQTELPVLVPTFERILREAVE